MRSAHVWMDGRLVPPEQATVPVLTPALHYGVAVFEGIRCYATRRGPAVFRLQEHMARLADSAAILGFRELGYTPAELAQATHETILASGFEECYIRPLVYLADGGWNLTVDTGVPRCTIAVWRWDTYLGADALEQGVRANISSFTRLHPNVAMTKAKISGNYVNSVLAKTESVRLGFDEAILLDPQGYVAECTGENIFVVNRGRLLTPPTSAILEGLTRDAIITLAGDAGLPVVEQPVSRDDLYRADEIFVCGTAAEVIGLREVDFRRIGSGRTGPITRQLQQAYHAVVRGEHPRSEEWLAYVRSGAEAESQVVG
ncbi:MAG: branched-chain amino acid transaminase [Acidobacteria bacterium]|nr:branched-chain amino acid transaminase [Acidobacteriota bacterium]